jgi:hypothetical protein
VGRVTVLVLHADAGSTAEPLTRGLTMARRQLAARHRDDFLAAGADDVELVAGRLDDTPFGSRLRTLVGPLGRRGIVVLGSGALPLARPVDHRAFVAVARSGARQALANDRYSADAIAVGRADVLASLPPGFATDNALPRWLAETARVRVADLRTRWRLLVDLDSPLDLALVALARRGSRPVGGGTIADLPLEAARTALAGVARVLADPRAEVVIAGRTSASSLRWLERRTACRVRALVEERGLRASMVSVAHLGSADGRPPASSLGLLLDREGPERLGTILARLAEAAIVDSRVLLAHRLGADERRWPTAEDRFASDLLLPARVRDPWLRALTASALDAPIPVALGGHTLVGPGLRLVARAAR